MTVSTAIDIRQRNKERIRYAIQQHEKCTKADIARETELSMATCSTALNEMLETGEILKVDQTGFNIGRPADLFTYNRDYLHVLGLCTAIQNGQQVLEYAIADAFGRIISREKMAVEQLDYDLLEALITTCILQDSLIRAVCLGIPGHAQNGYIEDCDIMSLSHLDFAGKIREKHDVQVIVENDMNFIAYRLYHGCEEEKADCAVLYFPTEENSFVGCGFMVNGRLLKGKSMYAGELASMAHAFGMPRVAQRELMKDRDAFRQFVMQMIVAVSCTINPAHMTLMGNNLNAEDLADIHDRCLQFISEKNLPTLQVDNNVFDNYVEGLVRFALDSVLYPILI